MEVIRSVKEFVTSLMWLTLLTCSSSTGTEASSSSSSSSSSSRSSTEKKHFVLIHGAGHGAWSWYKVATLLKHSGHKVTALDLGASGINPIQVQQLPWLSDYVDQGHDVPAPQRKDYSGVSQHDWSYIGVFMERFPEKIAVTVYVTAFMSGPTLNYSTIFAEVITSSHV